MKLKVLSFALLAIFIAGCAPIKQEAPVAPNFVFTPPSTVPPSKNAMSIAILHFSETGFEQNQSGLLQKFNTALVSDMEKLLLAKGFTVAGTFPSYGDMTFAQKEKSSLVMINTLSYEVRTAYGKGVLDPWTATVNGWVEISFVEPMTKELVWKKQFALPTITQQVEMGAVHDQYGREVRDRNGVVVGITEPSNTALFNTFYAAVFAKIWEQIDPREIRNLKSDADKLKNKTHFKGN